MLDVYLGCFKNYANFNGRADRTEYWTFTLMNALIIFVLYVAAMVFSGGEGTGTLIMLLVLVIFELAIAIPSIAVTVRRLHDIDKSGWWYFIALVPFGSIVLLVFMCTAGSYAPNRYDD